MADSVSDGPVLVLNAGSSSIKFALFDAALVQTLSGMADAIGGASTLRVGEDTTDASFGDQGAALDAILDALQRRGIPPQALRAVGHRVVHGGATLTRAMRVTDAVQAEIENCTPLAPLHNPHNLAPMRALARIAPDLPQFASFDTSFHATNPKVATRYAIPDTVETRGIRRYGFHGLSYASLVRRLPEISGHPLPDRILAFHLGNGASLCAIRSGQSIATTMGYSPLEGLTMGTRCGGIDANAVLRLVEENGIARTKTLLNTESGLRGLSGGISDMRKLMQDPSEDSAFAVEHFCYWALRHAGSMMAALEGVDAIALTGGIGENARDVRARILKGLAWAGVQFDPDLNERNETALHTAASAVSVWIVPAEEERQIAMDALRLLEAG